MRVVHIITGLATGGAERSLYNLLQGAGARDIDSCVISLSDEGTIGPQIRLLGIPVTTLDISGGRSLLSGLKKLRWVIKEIQPEIIHGWMYHGNLAATVARNLAPECPVLVWNIRHSLYHLGNEKPVTRQVIRANRLCSISPDSLLYNSMLSREQHESFGFSSLNGRVIPNGVDLAEFCFSDDARKRVRAELGIPEDARVVGHVARLHPMKDHSVFLRAAAGLALRYPRTHFLLSGRDVSPARRSLERLIPAQVRDRLHLIGERDDVSSLMSAMDIFCLSSAWGEGFPSVLGEAMATALPCVTTNVGDSSVIVGETGIVVPTRDEDALTTGIERLLVMSPEDRHSLGLKARTRIETRYSLGRMVEQYAGLYEGLMQTKSQD